MEFSLRIKASEYYQNVWELPHESGYDLVTEARKRLELQELSHSLIDSSISNSRGMSTILQIPESYVDRVCNESGLFGKSSLVTLIVPINYLNDFFYLYIEKQADHKTGLIKKVSFKYAMRIKSFIDHWIDLGYPTEIGIVEKDKE